MNLTSFHLFYLIKVGKYQDEKNQNWSISTIEPSQLVLNDYLFLC
jgi:hypothetical protein